MNKNVLPEVREVIEENIQTVADIERGDRNERNPGERLVDGIAALAGDVRFFLIHVVWIAIWIIFNSGKIPGLKPFDPYPWEVLRTILPLEAILIACTVLMIQGRMKKQNQQRAHLELQVALLAEMEATKTLQMLRALCVHHGLKEAHDPEVQQLIRKTEPDKLMDKVQKNLGS